MKLRILLLVLVLSIIRIAQAQNVVDIISNSPDHNTLETAILAAGLDTALAEAGSVTVFAPTDDAFAALPDGTVNALLADPQGLLTEILTYHVVGTQALAFELMNGQTITTLNGKDVTVTINNGGIFINNALVTVEDILADNGVVHVINAVLLPPATTVYDIIAGSDVHSTLKAAIDIAGLDAALQSDGPFTVFAPTDDAFAALPDGTIDALLADPQGLLTEILTYHVVGARALSSDLSDGQTITTLNGEDVTVTIGTNGVFINNALVTVVDLEAENGVVHVIDAVLLPPTNTVYDIIANSDIHTTLKFAIDTAGLAETLKGEGPFTVFAPTDEAFEALPAGTIPALLENPQGLLRQILLYHATSDTLRSTDLNDGQIVFTLLPFQETVTVTIDTNGVFINNAKVTIVDLIGDNGIVHVIDAVLLPGTQSVMDIIANSTDHAILTAAINIAQLSSTLDGPGSFTVFAPTDDAFLALPDGTIDALLADSQGLLTDILTYHVVGATALSGDLADGQMITTLNGKDVTVTIDTNGVFINNALVTVADLTADNGVVHVINAVLLPPTTTVYDIIAGSDVHTTLKAAIDVAGLDAALQSEGPFTVFAPTDDAFAALPDGTIDALLADPQGLLTDILTYHVVGATALSGDLADGQMITTLNGKDVTVTIDTNGVFINNALVTVADLTADNGVVHVINAVLLPPTTTVYDIIAGSDVHTTLKAAIDVAGLDAALQSEGPFTVFAPTDDAFAALPDGTIDALLADPQGLLTDILTYHVVGATALSGDLADGQMITTLNGKDVTVTIDTNGVFINNALVTVADLTADNGVVHVINAVLLPPTTTVYDIIAGSDVHTTLKAAIDVAGLDAALQSEGPFTVFAPTDDAFAALPDGTIDALLADPQGLLREILAYHVVGATALSGDLADGQMITTLNGKDVTVTIDASGVFINDALVTVADLTADNGVVHVINAVLLPPSNTVYDIIAGSDVHTTLKTAIDLVELDDLLKTEGFFEFSVFAPTDAAFAALPDGVLDALIQNPDALVDVLAYHVGLDFLPYTSDFITESVQEGFPYIVMGNGKTATFSITPDGIFINDVQITVADLVASNGVVHVIDAVLIAPDSTIIDVVEQSPDHTLLSTILDTLELKQPLRGYGPFTLFAPTDAAILALGPETINNLLNEDLDLLEDIVAYHLIGGKALSSDLSDGQEIPTLLGENVTVTINNDGIFINNAKVTVADIETDNGVVHVIDAVLLPPTNTVYDIIANSDVHTILKAAIDIAGLDGALQGEGPFTVFAPTDDAFNALPDGTIDALLADPQGLLTDILTYHVVGAEAYSFDLSEGQRITTLNGQDVTVMINQDGIFINDAKVIIADIPADNGVVHVIDAILLPESSVNDVTLLNDVNVYPNPTALDATLSTPEDVNTVWDIQVIDLQGKSVMKTSAAHGDIIQTQSIHSGTYLLHISDGKRSIIKKLVKF